AFFFSSGRRHTRFSRDWSSDVCSSDLPMHHLVIGEGQIGRAIIDRALAEGDSVTVLRRSAAAPEPGARRVTGDLLDPAVLREARSEERRVGKAGRTRWSPGGAEANPGS